MDVYVLGMPCQDAVYLGRLLVDLIKWSRVGKASVPDLVEGLFSGWPLAVRGRLESQEGPSLDTFLFIYSFIYWIIGS